MSMIHPETFLINNEKIIIRSAVEADAANIIHYFKSILINGEGWVSEIDEVEHITSIEKEKKWINDFAENPNKILIVVEHNNEIIGSINFATEKRRKLSHQGEFALAILPAYRAMGLGKLLMSHFIAWVESNQNIERVVLSVFSTNLNAIRLYKKFGFHEEGIGKKSLKFQDGTYADEIWMCRFFDR